MIAPPPVSGDLAQLQRQFLAQLRGCGADDDIGAMLACGQMPADLGLGIYGHAYGARLREALEHDHAVLGLYLGDELWERMCEGFIALHPSRVRSLRDFGSGLPGFLASVEPFAAHPQLSELARFERCLLDGFDAADDERLAWDDLLALPQGSWPTLRLTFHPSFQLHEAGFNSVETWQAIKAGEAPPAAVAACACWALWRDEERVGRFRSLESREHVAISHFLQGGSFAGLCEALAADLPLSDVPAVAIGYLQSWCAEGWLARVC
jgi:hypothetical protein